MYKGKGKDNEGTALTGNPIYTLAVEIESLFVPIHNKIYNLRNLSFVNILKDIYMRQFNGLVSKLNSNQIYCQILSIIAVYNYINFIMF